MAKSNGEGTIRQRSDGTWEGRLTIGYDAKGKQIRKSFYGKRKKDVQDKMDVAKVELTKGTYVEPTKLTVAQWMDEWLSVYRKNAKKNTFDRYTGVIEGYVKPMLGTCKLKDLRKDMVQSFVNSLIDKGLAGRTVKCYYAVLEMALRQAYKDELIPKDLVKDIILPPVENKERKVLTQREQDIFIEAAKDFIYGDIYILILGTGLRIGEALALTWDDVDFEKEKLRINKTTVYTKGGGGEHFSLSVGAPKTKASNRTIPLFPDVIKLLKSVKIEQVKRRLESGGEYTNNNLVFSNRDGNLYISRNVQKQFQALLKNAGLEYMTIHGLRHTFATRGLEQGIELRVMQEFLGHSSIKMTGDLYTHVLEDKKKDSIMKLAGTLNF